MVDPCRKINILSEEDQKFIDELEEEFGKRFTEEDPEFMALCEKKLSTPPIVDPWMQRHNNRGGWGGGRNQRDHHRAGGGNHHHHRQHNRGYGGGYNNRPRYNDYNHQDRNDHRERRDDRNEREPMNNMNYNRDGNSRNDHYNPPR